MDELTNMLKQFTALDAALYVSVIPLALLVRFGRAYWNHFGDAHTLSAALGLGGVGAALVLTIEPHPWQMIVLQAVSLSVAVLLAERTLRAMAEKLTFLPRDNEYVRPDSSGSRPPPRG